MDRFWDLLERSVIVQGILTLAFAGTVCAMTLMARPVSQEIWTALAVILGFWFGSKVQNEVHAHERKRTEKSQED
jgi:hypothetical protein